MNKPSVLVVDDEPAICELLEITLRRMDIDVVTACELRQAREYLQNRHFDLCLTDMKLPDGDGLDLVEYIQLNHPKLPVAVITAHGNMESAIRALKSGAFDFVSKPLDLHVLRNLVTTALKLVQQEGRDRRSRHILLGDSPAMREIRSKITKLSRNQAPIFISGESGTGKELVARLIHNMSPRSEKPFVAVNCGAIPHDLMESEFFGHRKGSFTGAVADKQGLFQAAHGGTLFLDEVADLPLSLQVKLLRAIQEKSIRPLGEPREIPVDVRIVSATHKNLAEMVQTGDFRQDLFYRINVIEIRVPPLRERRSDIPSLVDHILARLAPGSDAKVTLSPEAMNALMSYPFPGNVRELENILERAVALCDGHRILAEDLNLPTLSEPALPTIPDETPAVERGLSLESYMDEIEKQAIIKALEKTRWNRTAAAKQLGITFRALRYKLKKLGLD
ncbi:sigma-54-dependent transcriptional regulator [Methylocaldum szegediense]|uniref:Response regulator protein PilR n=1 Tax=Methylocaldum szegediense TaxID=73780 RepID=A0ABM9I7P4_9GAMM|nr:sigma-54 dependent transcriptional regulator [Methylocaldum szegediense]CAI8945268.1 Response regulator protein PilR [Methylocaldum szegediense]